MYKDVALSVHKQLTGAIANASYHASHTVKAAAKYAEQKKKLAAQKAEASAKQGYTQETNIKNDNIKLIEDRLHGEIVEPKQINGPINPPQKAVGNGEIDVNGAIDAEFTDITPGTSMTNISVDEDVRGLNKVKERFRQIAMGEPKQIGMNEPKQIEKTKQETVKESKSSYGDKWSTIVHAANLSEDERNALIDAYNKPIDEAYEKNRQEWNEYNDKYQKEHSILEKDASDYFKKAEADANKRAGRDQELVDKFQEKYGVKPNDYEKYTMQIVADYLVKGGIEKVKEWSSSKDVMKLANKIKDDPDLEAYAKHSHIYGHFNAEEEAEYKRLSDKARAHREEWAQGLDPYRKTSEKLEKQRISEQDFKDFKKRTISAQNREKMEKKFGISAEALLTSNEDEKTVNFNGQDYKFKRIEDNNWELTFGKSKYTIYAEDPNANTTIKGLMTPYTAQKESKTPIPKPKGKWYKVWSDNGEDTYEFKYDDEDEGE